MKKEIPAKTIVYCDCCGFECHTQTAPRRQNGGMYVHRDFLDQLGTPCANGGFEKHYCDHCLQLVLEAIAKVESFVKEDGK